MRIAELQSTCYVIVLRVEIPRDGVDATFIRPPADTRHAHRVETHSGATRFPLRHSVKSLMTEELEPHDIADCGYVCQPYQPTETATCDHATSISMVEAICDAPAHVSVTMQRATRLKIRKIKNESVKL